MKTYLVFLSAIVAFSCSVEEQTQDLAVLTKADILFQKKFDFAESNDTGIVNQGIEWVTFKVLGDQGIQKFGLYNSLETNQYYAIMEVKVKDGVDYPYNEMHLDNIVLKDGYKFDAAVNDNIFTSTDVVKFKDISELQSNNRTEEIKFGCSHVYIIYNGGTCKEDGYKCNAWLGYCWCIEGCYFEVTIK